MSAPASRRKPRAFAAMFAQDVIDSFGCDREGLEALPSTHDGEPWKCWHCYARFALAAIRKLRPKEKP